MIVIDDLSELTFWATNTKESEKLIKDNEDKMTNGMTDSEKKAYLLGVENAFSTMNQLLNQGIDSRSVQFYNPDVEMSEEFSVEELIEWLSKQDET